MDSKENLPFSYHSNTCIKDSDLALHPAKNPHPFKYILPFGLGALGRWDLGIEANLRIKPVSRYDSLLSFPTRSDHVGAFFLPLFFCFSYVSMRIRGMKPCLCSGPGKGLLFFEYIAWGPRLFFVGGTFFSSIVSSNAFRRQQ
jgi:hypothetical protein